MRSVRPLRKSDEHSEPGAVSPGYLCTYSDSRDINFFGFSWKPLDKFKFFGYNGLKKTRKRTKIQEVVS